jgi:RNA polymerase sigma-70 factor (ECF subfamily)
MSSTEQARWFTEHVQPHEPALRAYLSKRFPTLPDHDDLVQETYVRMLRVRDPSRLEYAKAFLFTTARNAAIDLFRRSGRVAHTPIDDSAELRPLEEPVGVVESLERQQRLEVLLEALGGLPERCREVMMLRYLDGFACKEIAAHLGISLGTVKNHLLKGVHACVRHFEARGLVSPDSPAESPAP